MFLSTWLLMPDTQLFFIIIFLICLVVCQPPPTITTTHRHGRVCGPGDCQLWTPVSGYWHVGHWGYYVHLVSSCCWPSKFTIDTVVVCCLCSPLTICIRKLRHVKPVVTYHVYLLSLSDKIGYFLISFSANHISIFILKLDGDMIFMQ